MAQIFNQTVLVGSTPSIFMLYGVKNVYFSCTNNSNVQVTLTLTPGNQTFPVGPVSSPILGPFPYVEMFSLTGSGASVLVVVSNEKLDPEKAAVINTPAISNSAFGVLNTSAVQINPAQDSTVESVVTTLGTPAQIGQPFANSSNAGPGVLHYTIAGASGGETIPTVTVNGTTYNLNMGASLAASAVLSGEIHLNGNVSIAFAAATFVGGYITVN
jgi:hypothetical protein